MACLLFVPNTIIQSNPLPSHPLLTSQRKAPLLSLMMMSEKSAEPEESPSAAAAELKAPPSGLSSRTVHTGGRVMS